MATKISIEIKFGTDSASRRNEDGETLRGRVVLIWSFYLKDLGMCAKFHYALDISLVIF